MKLRVEISLYPLKDNFIPSIDDFISRLNHQKDISVVTNPLSTQIFGDYDRVMEIFNSEMKQSFLSSDQMVFVVKFHSPVA